MVETPEPIRMAINNVEYTNLPNGAMIHLFGRDEKGIPHHIQVTSFRPYFYITAAESEMNHPKQIELDTSVQYQSIYGIPVVRAYVPVPSDVRELRDRYSHYEADVLFTTRFMVDTGLTGGVEAPSDFADYRELKPCVVNSPARVCVLDIECEDERGFPRPDRDAVICITCWDSFDKKYTTFFYNPKEELDVVELMHQRKGSGKCFDPDIHKLYQYDDESMMFHAFANYIRDKDPDVITGWNVTEFDTKYIMGRMEHLGIPPSKLARLPGTSEKVPLRGRSVFDLLAGYRRLQETQKESYRLDAIAEEELGEKKLRLGGNISTVWKEHIDQMIEYNVKDVELCVGINNKNKIIDFYVEIARYVGCPLESTTISSTVVDIYIMRRAHDKFVLPSKGMSFEEMFEGATVFEPSLGLKENVIVFDLKALYPMSMMTMNASPETKDPAGACHSPNGIHFKCEPDGLTRSIISELMTERDKKKAEMKKYPYDSNEYNTLDMQQKVLKIIMNTYYGVSGYARFRIYDREIASAVTSAGRTILEHTKNIIESHGYKVIYGDTDSSFVHFPPKLSVEELIKRAKHLEDEINASYPKFAKEQLGSDKCYFSIKFEKMYKRFFQAGKKKRYAGHLIWREGTVADKIDIVGFEIRRSDFPHVTKEVQKQVIDMILRGGEYKDVKKYLSEFITKYRSGKFTYDEIGIPGGIQKDLDKYEKDDAHLRGARYSNKHLKMDFKGGSKPKRLYIKSVSGTYPQTDVVCFEYGDQIPKEFVVDYDVMLDKTIKQPIMRIIDSLGWSWESIDPNVSTLADWGI